MDIQYSADLRISKNRIMDIQKSICGYPKIELWISKNRIKDIHKWGIKSKTAPHKTVLPYAELSLREAIYVAFFVGVPMLSVRNDQVQY